jgi:hypothetical protein
MKRNLIVILPLVVMSLMLNATAHAQSLVQANVPFAFKVGSATLPAGTYVIKTLGNSTIAIQNRQTGAGAMSTTRREYPRNSGPKLVFRHMGNQYLRRSGESRVAMAWQSLPPNRRRIWRRNCSWPAANRPPSAKRS